jgi:hypothetical protein
MLAFSLPSPVETAGAIAGFAAILGLAVLALLYFAQARELKRLREWAGQAPDRSQPTTSPTRSAEPPPAQPAPGEAPDEQDAAAAQTRDSAPAGKPVGAPVPEPAAGASAAAKPATSTSAASADSAQPTSVAPVGTGGPALASASPEARSIGGDRDEPAAAPGASAPADAVPAPMTAAGAGAAGNGHGGDRPVAPVRRPPPAGARPAAAAAAGVQRTGSGPDGGAGPSSPSGAGSGSSRPGWVVPLLTGLALLAIALLAFGAVQLISGGDDSSTSGGAAPSSAAASGGGSATPRRTGAAFSNGSTTVAVLNGTPVAGLGKRVADKLDAAGFEQGAVTNASDQARSATIVSFLPGNRSEAESVRKVLKVSGVEPMDPTTKAIACVPPNPCPPVVVTVGSDRGQ